MKKKKYKLLLGILIILSMIFMISIPVNADSGWDSDYGGGSDWGGSSDWGSSSDWDSGSSYDHDWSSGSSGGGYYGDGLPRELAYLFVAGFIILYVVVVCLVIRDTFGILKRRFERNAKKELNDTMNEHVGVYFNDKVGDFIPGYDKDKLLDELYQKFVDVQNAWMEFDYDSLKKLCTDELFESYKSDLEVLAGQNGKNIMSDFKKVDSRIIDIKNDNGKVIILIYLEVLFHDYVIDATTNKVTKGDKHTLMHNRYNLQYIINSSSDEDICPSCGAKLEGRDCPYCGSHVDVLAKDFVLSNKTRIR